MFGIRVCRNAPGNSPSPGQPLPPPEDLPSPPGQGPSQTRHHRFLQRRLPPGVPTPELPTSDLATPELPSFPDRIFSQKKGFVYGDGCEPVAVDPGESKSQMYAPHLT